MSPLLPRRRFLAAAASLLAAPAIVRASSIMPVRPVALEPYFTSYQVAEIIAGNIIRIWYGPKLVYEAPALRSNLSHARAA